MNHTGMQRFLSRKEKDGHPHKRQKSRDKSTNRSDDKKVDKKIQPLPNLLNGFFKYDPERKLDEENEAKIQTMRKQLLQERPTEMTDQQLQYGLFSKHAMGDVKKALELVRLFQDSVEGMIKPYDPEVEMKGAVNNNKVTCWLDSLLFSMFAQLPSFEPILYTIHDDEPRRRLSTLIRLWVNMLRSGLLIETDVTCYILEALTECGWEEDMEGQQDASEAFSFITGQLQLPLLTLKMDLYHTGVPDPKDDHKQVYERLLEVGIPPNHEDGSSLTLEECLENYFNNRVEVKRLLERSQSAKLERSNTMSSTKSTQEDKKSAIHVEAAEISSPSTPVSIHPPTNPLSPTRGRTQSIVRRRLIDDDTADSAVSVAASDTASIRTRKQSIRTEVALPAWYVLSITWEAKPRFLLKIIASAMNSWLPVNPRVVTNSGFPTAWYTKTSIPKNSSLEAHFSKTRPVLGICLKRYSMTNKGEAVKNSTYIDIPLEIKFPHFVPPDEASNDQGPQVGNFKLSLQSIICHEGNAVHQGHYFSYIRAAEVSDGDSFSARRMSNTSLPPNYPMDRWIAHNDLGNPRVEYVDITEVLKKKIPYLLFYQVQPIFDDSSQAASTADLQADMDADLTVAPPSYDSGIDIKFTESSPQVDRNPFHALVRQQEQEQKHHQQGYFDDAKDDVVQPKAPSIRLSSEIERPRNSMTLPEDRRGSIAFTDTSLGSAHSLSAPDFISAPATPSEETTAHRLSRAASRFRMGSKSRPTSSSDENRISGAFLRLAARSKEQLNKIDIPLNKDAVSPAPVTDVDRVEPVSVATEEVALKPPADTLPSRKTSKRGRKQEKLEKKAVEKERDAQLRHSHHRKDKGKEVLRDGKVPERECTIM